MAHTPGPWRSTRVGDRALIVTRDGLKIGEAETQADADFIAALPEMLAALSNIVGRGAQHEHTCDKAEHDADGGCIWCQARAAIAKAEGRS